MIQSVLDYLFGEISQHLTNKKQELGYTYEYISNCIDSNGKPFIYDKKLLNNIFNCKIIKGKNPYLMSDNCIACLPPVLGFADSEELLWGWITCDSIATVFKKICVSFVENYSEEYVDTTARVKTLIENVLIDYIPYAENSILLDFELHPEKYNLVKISGEKEDKFFLPLFFYMRDSSNGNVSSDNVFLQQPIILDEAIEFLYQKCRKDFENIFKNYIHKHNNSLQKFVKGLTNFVEIEFYNMLELFLPTEDSLGLRVKNIMLSDWKLQNKIGVSTSQERLLEASLKYISELREVQESNLN